MNVLHLVTHLDTGGITQYILRLAVPMRQKGVETFIASGGGTCSLMFHEAGVSTYDFPIRTKSELNPKIYRAIPSVIQLIHEKKIDLIHAHTRVTQVMAFWIQRLTGIPVVTTCHGFYKKRLGRLVLPAWGERVVAISEGVEEHLLKDFKVSPRKVCMVHNGVDIEALDQAMWKYNSIEVKAFYGFQAGDIVLGNIARMVPDKGQEYLIRAIAELKTKFPQIRGLMVGDGRGRSDLERLSRELKLQNRILFTGYLHDIVKPLAAMDLFVFPATWREGFGLSIVEAMVCRKAVVATEIWNLANLIQNGVTGVLVPPKQTDPLVKAITHLLETPEVRKRLEKEGRSMVEKLFSIQQMVEKIGQIYQEVLALKRGQKP